MFNRILVPLDGSPLAERAIPHVRHFARIFGGSIVLLQVLDPSPYRENASAVEPLNWQIRKTEADLYIKGVAARLRAQGLTAEYALREGRTPENIVDFALNESIDLVVLTSHGAGGLTRWNASSVVTKVVEKVYMPVLIIRAYNLPDLSKSLPASAQQDAAAGRPAGEPAPENASRGQEPVGRAESRNSEVFATASLPVTSGAPSISEEPDVQYHRILLPIDCSRRAECSLPAGIGLVEGEKKLHQENGTEEAAGGAAGASSAAGGAAEEKEQESSTLFLAAVLKPPEMPIPAPYPDDLQKLSEQFMKISRDTVKDYLAEMQSRIPAKTETRIVESESISSAIHEIVDKENIDLVVLCAHGRTGRITWPYGSVARNYIEHGTQTVLVIQDVPREQVRPTAAETAAQKYGRR